MSKNNVYGNGAFNFWLIVMHLSPFLAAVTGIVILPLLFPIIMLMCYREKGSFQNNQAREALRFYLINLLFCGAVFGGFYVLEMSPLSQFLIILPYALVMTTLPLVAAFRVFVGIDYAYPYVFSPRRTNYAKAYGLERLRRWEVRAANRRKKNK